jgi:predicted nucleotidyltransferase
MPEPESPRDLLSVLLSLVSWLSEKETPYAIIGGVAIGLVAQARATQDIDAVVWLDVEDFPAFIDSGVRFGFLPRVSDALEFAMRSRVFLLRHEDTGIGVDISCGALPFEEETIARALDFNAGDLTLKVATPEDLIIMKAVAHRKRDLIDIDNLLTVYQDLDLSRVRNWVREFAQVLEKPELVDDLENLLNGRR